MQHRRIIEEIEERIKIVEVLLKKDTALNEIYFADLQKISSGSPLLLKNGTGIVSLLIHKGKNVMVFQTKFPPFQSFGLSVNVDANKKIYVVKGSVIETRFAIDLLEGHSLDLSVGEKHDFFSGRDGAVLTVVIEREEVV